MIIGIRFLSESTQALTVSHSQYPLMRFFAGYAGGMEEGALILIAVSLLIGSLKGKYILGKSAKQGVARILSLPNPSSLKNIYSKKYYFLLGGMIALGISMKYIGLSPDIRGFVDVAIGSALINGAVSYFRMAFAKEHKPAV